MGRYARPKATSIRSRRLSTCLKADYVPKGFHLGPGPITGHPFGLALAPEGRQALIGFLKTL
jgi:hypothetical protein